MIQISTIFLRSAQALLLACFVFMVSCSDDDNSVTGPPITGEPGIRLAYDTLYATPEDAAVLETDLLGTAQLYEVHFDYGNGSTAALPAPGKDTIVHTFMYNATGTFNARVWGTDKQGKEYADSVVVVVLDYIRPSLAGRLEVYMTGLNVVTQHFEGEQESNLDTMYTREQETLKLVFSNYGPISSYDMELEPFPWHHSNALNYKSAYYFGWDSPTLQGGEITLSRDGSVIEHLSLAFTEVHYFDRPAGRIKGDTVAFSIELQNIPLSTIYEPTRENAVYEIFGLHNGSGTSLIAVDFMKNYWLEWNIHPFSGWHLLDYQLYSNFGIRLEFLDEK